MNTLFNKNFLILLSGQVISTFGNYLFRIAIIWYSVESTDSNANLALTGLALTIPAVTGLFLGVYVDRFRKKSIMIFSDVTRGLITLVLFTLVVTTSPPFLLVLGLVLLLEFFGVFFLPAQQSLIPQIVNKDKITSAVGITQSANTFAELTGLIGGGGLMALIGAPMLFLANAITFLASTISLFFVKIDEVIERTNQKKTTFVEEWKEGYRLLGRSKMLLRIIAVAIIANFAIAPLEIVLAAWVEDSLDGSGFSFSLINGGLICGILIGAAFVGTINKKFNINSIITFGFIYLGIGITIMGLFANLLWGIAIAITIGAFIGIINSAVESRLMELVPQNMMGRVFSSVQGFATIAMPLGMALIGYLITFLPIITCYILLGSCVFISGLSLLVPLDNDLYKLKEVSLQKRSSYNEKI